MTEAPRFQVQPSVFPGYMWLELRCPVCNAEWIGVAAVGTEGITCPKCRMYDREFVWTGPRADMPHDGAWLSGQWDLPCARLDGSVRTPATASRESQRAVKPWLQAVVGLVKRVLGLRRFASRFARNDGAHKGPGYGGVDGV